MSDRPLKPCGFDDAFIGYDAATRNLIYDYDKCIQVILEDFKESEDTLELGYDDAIEHMEVNVVGSYMGKGTPIFMHKSDSLEEYEEWLGEYYEDA